MKVSCALYLEVESEQELLTLDWDSLPQPVMVLGGGSNLLFTKDFPGTVLHIALRHCERTEESWTLGAGVVFDDFCAQAAAEGLWGPENLSLIPGECGASAVQNIGAYGVEVKDILADIRAYDRAEGRFVHIDPASCGYGYRTSKFKTEWKGRYIITAVTYRLSREPRPVLDYGGIRKALEGEALTPQVIRNTIIGIRREKLPDPSELGSAGSFFKNPVISREHFARIVETARSEMGPEATVPHFEMGDEIKVPAAWMIDRCGFKGQRLGGAQVYPRQPLVLVNATGSATPGEVLALRDRIIAAVAAKFGVTLSCEVETVAPEHV